MQAALLSDLDHLDPEAMKALIRTQHERLSTRASEIAHLKLLLDKLQRMLFGARSEKLVRQVAQLELQLEELETSRGEEEVTAPLPLPMEPEQEPRQSSRRTLPDHLPREKKRIVRIQAVAPVVEERCASSVKMSLRFSSMCPGASRSFVMCGRSSAVGVARR
jgi:hypothetical protein